MKAVSLQDQVSQIINIYWQAGLSTGVTELKSNKFVEWKEASASKESSLLIKPRMTYERRCGTYTRTHIYMRIPISDGGDEITPDSLSPECSLSRYMVLARQSRNFHSGPRTSRPKKNISFPRGRKQSGEHVTYILRTKEYSRLLVLILS